MQVAALRVNTRFEGTVLFVVFFDHKLPAFGTERAGRLEICDKVALWIIRATVEFLAVSL